MGLLVGSGVGLLLGKDDGFEVGALVGAVGFSVG